MFSSGILGVLAIVLKTAVALNVGVLRDASDPGVEKILQDFKLNVVGAEILSAQGSTVKLLHKVCMLIYSGADVIVSTVDDPRFEMAYHVAEDHSIPFITITPTLLDSEKDYKWAASIFPPFRTSLPILSQMFKQYEWMTAVVMSTSLSADTGTASLTTCASTDSVSTSAFPYRIERVPTKNSLKERLQWVKYMGYLNIIVYGDPDSINATLSEAEEIGLIGSSYKWILFNYPMKNRLIGKFKNLGHFFNVVPSALYLDQAHDHISQVLPLALQQLAEFPGDNPIRIKQPQSPEFNDTVNRCLMEVRDNDVNAVYFSKLFTLATENGDRRIFNQHSSSVGLEYDVWYFGRSNGTWVPEILSLVRNEVNSSEPSSSNRTKYQYTYMQGSGYRNQLPPLFGERIEVIASHEVPFVIHDNGKFEGFMVDVWEHIAKHYGLSYSMKFRYFGGKNYSTGEWRGMFGDVDSDWNTISIAPVFVSQKRSLDFDFTFPLWSTGYSFAIKRETYDNKRMFLKPLENKLWFAILLAICLASILLACLNWISPFGRRGEWIYAYEDIKGVRRRQRLFYQMQKNQLSAFGFLESIFFSWAIVTKSGWWTYPYSFSGRIVVCLLMIMTTTMISSYTAQLSARKTLAKLSEVVNTVDDLVSLGSEEMEIGELN